MHKKAVSFFGKLIRSKLAIGWVAVLVIGGGAYFRFGRNNTTYQFVPVTRGSITESVSITGNTTPAESASLTFGTSGIISHIYSALGEKVNAGQVLAELNTSDLAAGVRQAQANVNSQQAKLQGLLAGSRPEDIAAAEANVNTQQAKLEGLKAGARPEDIAAAQAAVDKAKQDLANMYGGIGDTSIDAYTKANDAVRTQINVFFNNGDTLAPKLTYTTSNSQAQIDAESGRLLSSTALNTWQDQLTNLSPSNTALETLLQNELSYLATNRLLLNNLSRTLDFVPGLNATTLATYKGYISVALNEVNTATKNLNTISQNIASQKLTVSQLQAQLDLKRAGSLPTDIAAQEAQVKQAQAQLDLKRAGSLPADISAQRAQVEQAQASVASAKAKLQNAQIVAPLSGIVTQFDAKVGQQASPNTPLISVMSSGGYEVDSGVSETDVSKIALGNKVSMTLDAFPGETFTGSVFYIAPSDTNTQGVVSYQVKISFDRPDSRLKSGLTANIDIQTKNKDGVLILPQYAILQNDQGTFVETLANNVIKQNSVTLGIRNQKGDVEVISGVSEGEQVLNIGLKSIRK